MGVEADDVHRSTPPMRFAGILMAALSGWLLCSCAPAPASAPRPLVLVHVMPWFESKAVSGHWGWHWTMGKTDPDKGALATHDRPLLGPYDSGSPTVIATQVALMKAAGIDGAIIDWNGPGGFADYEMIHRNTELLIAELKKAGLKFALCVEDNPGHRFMKEGKLTRAQATAVHGLGHEGGAHRSAPERVAAPVLELVHERAVLVQSGLDGLLRDDALLGAEVVEDDAAQLRKKV